MRSTLKQIVEKSDFKAGRRFDFAVQTLVLASVFDGMWWAVASLTTVGYGDIYPITTGGQFFTFFVLMIGIGIVAVPTGLLASALTHSRKSDGTREFIGENQ